MTKADKVRRQEQRLRQGIERLKGGRTAPPAVCREVLSLTPNANLMEIVSGVHEAIHKANRMERDGDRIEMGVIAIMAGYTLVRSKK